MSFIVGGGQFSRSIFSFNFRKSDTKRTVLFFLGIIKVGYACLLVLVGFSTPSPTMRSISVFNVFLCICGTVNARLAWYGVF